MDHDLISRTRAEIATPTAQGDLFVDRGGRRPRQPPKLQVRELSAPLADDRAYWPWLADQVYQAGAAGIPLDVLIRRGIAQGWFQDGAAKHAMEKLARPFFETGVMVINTRPGGPSGLGGKIALHPAFYSLTLPEPRLQRAWHDLKRLLLVIRLNAALRRKYGPPRK